ncbi:MAG: hypothetical protein M5U16_11100 [Hyphomicrobium sp.]|nr:hypothetical protein [Hyphomicrobium sp.]
MTLPSDDLVVPTKPRCSGGNLILLKTMPPRWRCVCPDGTTRVRTGRNAYACEGSPDSPQSDPKSECLAKGWKWTRKGCVKPDSHCPKGYIGTPPNCLKLPSLSCPNGYVGKPPKCRKLLPIKCPKGFIGSPPNCRKLPPIKCPKGYTGRPPNCTKVTLDSPSKQLKSIKKQLQKLKALNED